MAINVDTLPKESTQRFSETGTQLVQILDAVMETSQSTGVPQIRVKLRTRGGAEIHEFYQDSDKKFMQFKLGRLIDALELQLSGEVTLQDIHRLVSLCKGKIIIAQLKSNDRGYGEVDYSSAAGGLGLERNDLQSFKNEPAPTATAETAQSLMDVVEDLGSPKLDITQDTSAFAPQQDTPTTPTAPTFVSSDDF